MTSLNPGDVGNYACCGRGVDAAIAPCPGTCDHCGFSRCPAAPDVVRCDCPEPDAVAARRGEMRRLAGALADMGASLEVSDRPAEDYIEVPVGDLEALQVEPLPRSGDGDYVLFWRQWSRDGGLSGEQQVAVCPAAAIVQVTRGVVLALGADQDAAAAAVPYDD